MKKVISILLVFAMILSCTAVFASAAEVKTSCKGNCDTCPTIVIPGIGQSNVWLLDDDGNYVLDDDGNKINCFPGYFDTTSIVLKVLGPLLLSLLTQHDIGLSKALQQVVRDGFAVNMCDDNGNNTGNFEVEKYPYSVAECSEYEKNEIFGAIPLRDYAKQVGEDHLYFFAYNSFGNHVDAVNELYAFIQTVKAETGHSRVNIVPISMGGSIANGLLEYYPEVMNDLNKVVYIVPALNGSTIVGDALAKDVTFFDADYLYNGFLETLMDESDARLVEVLLRIFPDEVLMNVLSNVVDVLAEEVFAKNTSMWALTPKEYYPELSKKYLSSPERAQLKAQTDKYYQAQLHSLDNIQKLVDNGVQVFNLVDYDYPLYQIGNSCNDENGDGIIQLSSTSMGAYAAKVGETLPDGYVQAGTYCSDPDHNHISPDRVVDASTGLLPDTTFYFDGQDHEKTARNDIIIKLATKLLATNEITDVYSSPDFPQFNVGRDTRKVSSLLSQAKSVDVSSLDAAVAAELNAAIAQAEAMLGSTVGFEGDAKQAEEKLQNALVAAGARQAEEDEESSDTAEKISLWLFENFGTNGFSEMLPLAVNLLFKNITEFFNEILGKIF